MAVSNKPWGDISQADYKDADAYCAACLVDLNGSGPKTKDKCYLPVKEPGGAYNANGIASAVAYLARTKIPPKAKTAAAKKLISLYKNVLQRDPPDSLSRYQ